MTQLRRALEQFSRGWCSRCYNGDIPHMNHGGGKYMHSYQMPSSNHFHVYTYYDECAASQARKFVDYMELTENFPAIAQPATKTAGKKEI